MARLPPPGDFALAGHYVRLWRRNHADVVSHRAEGGSILVNDFRADTEPRRR